MSMILAVIDVQSHEVVNRLVPHGDVPQIEGYLVVEAPFETSIGWRWDPRLQVFIQPSPSPTIIDEVGDPDSIG